MLPARTAPSQGIGLARILFCRELRYVGGSSDMVMVMSGIKLRSTCLKLKKRFEKGGG